MAPINATAVKPLHWSAILPDLTRPDGSPPAPADGDYDRPPPFTAASMRKVHQGLHSPAQPGERLPGHIRNVVPKVAAEFEANVAAALVRDLDPEPRSLARAQWLNAFRLVNFDRLPPPAPPSKEWLEANVPEAYWGCFVLITSSLLEESWERRGTYYLLHRMLILSALKASTEACIRLQDGGGPH